MDAVSVAVAVVVILLTLFLTYAAYMSRKFRTFQKLGIPAVSPLPIIGNFREMVKLGIFEFHHKYYREFANEKVYGIYEPGNALLVIRDLDMIRDIMVKNFNSFVNRRVFTREKPFDSMLTILEDDHWRHVRNAVSPTFSTGKLRRMGTHVEESSRSLVANLRACCRQGEPLELKDVVSCYAMDVIASTGFGVSVDSLHDKSSPFVREAKNLLNISGKALTFAVLFPFLLRTLSKVGLGLFPKKSSDFFLSFVDAAIQNRKQGDEAASKRNDFIQLVINEENKMKESAEHSDSGQQQEQQERKGLTHEEVQGQGFIFILAGYDTVSTALSSTLFCLANNPAACARLQQELDTLPAGQFPPYEAVQALPYLDMCLNEAMRLYPPGFVIDRVCCQDCVIQGVKIPKGIPVVFPIVAIHHDPQYYPDPEKFDPERFTPENKAARHPFAHLPFGQGPRNCIGMRLALMEMKIALAAILQEMTPVPCDKTVYPPTMSKFQLKAEDGLWVKFVPRTKS